MKRCMWALLSSHQMKQAGTGRGRGKERNRLFTVVIFLPVQHRVVSAPRHSAPQRFHRASVWTICPLCPLTFQKPARLGQRQPAVTTVGGSEILKRGACWRADLQRPIFTSLESNQSLNPAPLHQWLKSGSSLWLFQEAKLLYLQIKLLCWLLIWQSFWYFSYLKEVKTRKQMNSLH